MDPETFYTGLWQEKKEPNYRPFVKRDWFHRFVLDPIFDPNANPRHEVALSLLRGGERLLDIGCWDGKLMERAYTAQLYKDVVGIDLTPGAIESTRAKGFKAEVADLNNKPLPFPDASFDGVSMLAVLEHIFDPYAVIREIYRVLRPGGEFVMEVPNVASFSNRIRILFGYLPITSRDKGWDGGHLHYFTKRALDNFLESEGFRILARKTSGGRVHLREWYISLLAGDLIYLCQRV